MDRHIMNKSTKDVWRITLDTILQNFKSQCPKKSKSGKLQKLDFFLTNTTSHFYLDKVLQ